ncbi:hypothetical protein [uncultured Draconibacterium sp.]|uniref:hypothetical protein n=1 Tax=uncultured Draconibacterium sp. TaxID=1573823 RepID=UPI0025F898B0|nr:hypothetical protein [uncultured Draconibacterium sp.]
MKRLSFITAIFAILAFNFGCHDGHTGENCIDENPYFEPEPVPEVGRLNMSFYTNSEINTYEEVDNYTIAYIQEGSKTVFRYQHSGYWGIPDSIGDYDTLPPPPLDGQFEIAVVFEVPSDKEEFLISGNDLKRAHAMYGSISMVSPGYIPITSGCIKGEKISDSEWQIDINILTEKDDVVFSKMISDRFVKR